MAVVGDVLSYSEMCGIEDCNLQRGMNFRLRSTHSVLLMSIRRNAPYADQVEDDGRTLVYEGHDEPKTAACPVPKNVDQPMKTPGGSLTQNGKFYLAAKEHKEHAKDAELVRVYEKIHKGIWVYNGLFKLVDAWQQAAHGRSVFKFRLELIDGDETSVVRRRAPHDIEHDRVIPTYVKVAVWRRDRGQCTKCGATDNLHFDHILPYSRGGSSLTVENIQLLCARHNLLKRDKIE